jgi:integrase
VARRGRRRGRRGDGSITERDGKYLARISTTEGGVRKRQSKTFDLRNDAEWWLSQARRHGEAPEDIRVADYLERWLNGKRSIRPSTRRQYEEHIRLHIAPVLGRHRLVDLRRRHVEAFVEDRLRHTSAGSGRPLSPATVGKVLVTLRSALEAAVPRDIPDNPAARVEAPKVERKLVRAVGADEAGRIIDAVTGTWVEPIARFLLGSALRIGEALSINQGDIDWDAGVVRIRESKTILRRVAVTDDALDALRMAIADAPRRGRSEPVFFSPRSRRGGVGRDRLTASSVTHALRPLLVRAGLEPMSAHGLRHAYATVALESGVPLELIADQLGHRSLAMTRRYAHVMPALRASSVAMVGDAVKLRRTNLR